MMSSSSMTKYLNKILASEERNNRKELTNEPLA